MIAWEVQYLYRKLLKEGYHVERQIIHTDDIVFRLICGSPSFGAELFVSFER